MCVCIQYIQFIYLPLLPSDCLATFFMNILAAFLESLSSVKVHCASGERLYSFLLENFENFKTVIFQCSLKFTFSGLT